jgi:hypothetical protein
MKRFDILSSAGNLDKYKYSVDEGRKVNDTFNESFDSLCPKRRCWEIGFQRIGMQTTE